MIRSGEATDISDIDFIIDKGRLRGLKFAGMLGDLQENFEKMEFCTKIISESHS